MNIFVLDKDPKLCAQAHCDKHVVKMCIEYAQLLSTAARLRGFEHGGYRSTHERHPCTIWAAKDLRNWGWLLRLAYQLGTEYTFRYDRIHKSTEALHYLPKDLIAEVAREVEPPRSFALAMPDEYKDQDVVKAYRAYYLGAKREIAVWTKRSSPAWWESAVSKTAGSLYDTSSARSSGVHVFQPA